MVNFNPPIISWGANSYGQLGQGTCTDECLLPKEVVDNDNIIAPDAIVQIEGGAGHTLILDNKGRIFGSGWSNYNQLATVGNCNVFKLISRNLKFTKIACGWDFSCAITETQDLYVWGSNKHYQLGFSRDTHPIITVPTKVPNIKAKDVACGLRHVAVITPDGRLKMAGSNNHCQAGLADPATLEPLKITEFTELFLPPVKMVGCGQKHTIAITENNLTYVWGDNTWGQLGLELFRSPRKNIPFLVARFNGIKAAKLHCGWTHNAILDESGDVWTWGRNNYRQLGFTHEMFDNYLWIPTKLTTLSNVQQVALGAEHNLAISQNKIFCWGWNEHGNCGTGNVQIVEQPTVMYSATAANKVSLVGCGTGQSFAVIT